MEEMQLKVEDADLTDYGRGIIRVGYYIALKVLSLIPGDIVEIRGINRTTAKVLWTLNISTVKIDSFTRQNAGVSIGEKVIIKKVEAPKAKNLFLALPESMVPEGSELQLVEHAHEIIKQHILKRPVFRGDIIPVTTSCLIASHQVIPLVAVETDPSNTIVQVSEETKIDLLHKAVKLPNFYNELKETVSKLAVDDANQILEPCDSVITKNEAAGEINLCETRDTSVSATKNMQKEITFSPSVFEIPAKFNMPNCVSVMMPFSAEFDDVYGCINDACYEVGMSCHKANDFWHHSAIIQDIFELIFRSSFVIVDFTGKNPNVFYEAGIAHVLGKTVLPITQNGDDIPFDLRHHRYVLYHNDREGLKKLKRELVSKLNFEKCRK